MTPYRDNPADQFRAFFTERRKMIDWEDLITEADFTSRTQGTWRAPTPSTPLERFRAACQRVPYVGEPPIYTGFKVGVNWGLAAPSRSIFLSGISS